MPAPSVAVVDYGTGNLRSVVKAFEALGSHPSLVTHPKEVGNADALVFPGQGCFPDCMERLRESGLADLIRNWIEAEKPYFGICLGLQVLFEHSEEGDCEGLGIFAGKTLKVILFLSICASHMAAGGKNHTQIQYNLIRLMIIIQA